MRYRFGPFELLPEVPLLLRHGQRVHAAPRVLTSLAILIQHRASAVSKGELLSAIWPDTFVEEGSLTQNISVLRKLLANDYPESSPIETITKFGYRFRVEVLEVPAEPPGGRGLERHAEPASNTPAAVAETVTRTLHVSEVVWPRRRESPGRANLARQPPWKGLPGWLLGLVGRVMLLFLLLALLSTTSNSRAVRQAEGEWPSQFDTFGPEPPGPRQAGLTISPMAQVKCGEVVLPCAITPRAPAATGTARWRA